MEQRYLMETPTLAVVMESSAKKMIVIPSASLIYVSLPLDNHLGLIKMRFQEKTVLMFAEHIRQRGKPVSAASA